MRTTVPERLLAISDEIRSGSAFPVTRLTILKKWFAARPSRLPAVAIWIGARAISRKGKTKGEAAELFAVGRRLVADRDELRPALDRDAAKELHDRLKEFQNEHTRYKYGLIRQIKNWNLFLLEQALCVYLWQFDSPSDGYKLVADYVTNYDPSVGSGLNGPSASKLDEFVRFLFLLEAKEEEVEE